VREAWEKESETTPEAAFPMQLPPGPVSVLNLRAASALAPRHNHNDSLDQRFLAHSLFDRTQVPHKE
jgi:hypothetical protein